MTLLTNVCVCARSEWKITVWFHEINPKWRKNMPFWRNKVINLLSSIHMTKRIHGGRIDVTWKGRLLEINPWFMILSLPLRLSRLRWNPYLCLNLLSQRDSTYLRIIWRITLKDSRMFSECDFSKSTSLCQEKHSSFNWQVASVPGGNAASRHFDKAHTGSDLTEVEKQTCKHVCSRWLLTMSASQARWELAFCCDICVRVTPWSYE